MRVAIVNPVWEPSAVSPEATLRRFRTLTGWAGAVAGAGAIVSVHQRFSLDATLQQGGVSYGFVRDGGGPAPARFSTRLGELDASVRAVVPDIVHVNGVVFPEWLRALRRALPPRIRMVAQDHGGWHPGHASLWSRLWVRRGLGAVDALLVSSPGHAAQWRAAHVASKSLMVADVMEASADLQPLPRPEARSLSRVEGDPAVLWVGRLTPNKDPLTMLEGFSSFLNHRRDAALTMVFNGGAMLGAVRARLAGDARLAARVKLAGEVAPNEIAAYYSAADIFVSASHFEGSGYAAIEAMACGAVPVLTDIPSFRVLTDHGRVGALWEPSHAQSLCQALARAAAGPCAALRPLVREQFESALSWEALGRRAVGIYRDVCAR